MSEKANPFILFITGSSGSGKSTVYEHLRGDERFTHLDFHDIDEEGVPTYGRKPWRQYRVEQLFYNAILALDNNQSTVICGISYPHEVIDASAYRFGANVHFLCLETSNTLIRRRLHERISTNDDKARFDMDFEERTILSAFEMQLQLRRQTENQRNGHILDVGELTINRLYEHVTTLLNHLGVSHD